MLVFCFLPVPYLKQSLKLNWSQETNPQSILKFSYSHFDRNRDDLFEKEKIDGKLFDMLMKGEAPEAFEKAEESSAAEEADSAPADMEKTNSDEE